MSILKVNKIQDTSGDDALTFDSSGNTTVNQTLTTTLANITTGGTNNLTISDGDLVVGTAGHGVSFAATSDGTTMQNELLDDYEEGYFTATCASSVTLHSGINTLAYTKIGRMVHIIGELRVDSDNTNQNFEITNLPFASSNNSGGEGTSTFNTCGTMTLHSWNVDGSNDLWGGPFMTKNTSTLGFKLTRDNGSYADMTADSGGYISISFSYMAAT